MKPKAYIIILLIFSCCMLSCKGDDQCGALSNPLSDADSDCVEDTSDNCPLVYNPSQLDIDEDGVGRACDSNDNDSSVAELVKSLQTIAETPLYPFPLENHKINQNQNCEKIIIGCGDETIATIYNSSHFESHIIDLVDPMKSYSRKTNCSAFWDDAEYPPAVFCMESNDFLFYISTNPQIMNRVEPCDFFVNEEISHPQCNSFES